MNRLQSYTKVFIALVLFSMVCNCFATGGFDYENLASSSSSSGHHDYRLESSPMGRFQTKDYANLLNSRLKDMGWGSEPLAKGLLVPREDLESFVSSVQDVLKTESGQKGLLYLGNTPDSRKVHAVLLKGAQSRSPNIAIISTPKVWRSLNQKIQLHTFAQIDNSNLFDLHQLLQHDFNYSQLDSLARNALPKTPQSEFDNLLPRFPL